MCDVDGSCVLWCWCSDGCSKKGAHVRLRSIILLITKRFRGHVRSVCLLNVEGMDSVAVAVGFMERHLARLSCFDPSPMSGTAAVVSTAVVALYDTYKALRMNV